MQFRSSIRTWLGAGLMVGLAIHATACAEDEEQEELESSEDSEESAQLPTLSDLVSPQTPDEDEESASKEGPNSNDTDEPSKEGPNEDPSSEDPEPDPKEEPTPEDPKEDKPKSEGPHQDVCDEKVPAKHFVDDIPAYSQCAASLNAKIWSDDGKRTATSSQGEGWVPTQFSGGYQCTEFAKRYMYFRFGVEKFPNGNAGLWCEGVTPPDLEKVEVPVHGDLVVFGPGDCGASLATGHVAVVDKVDEGKKMVEFVEQNQANRRSCAFSATACFLHAKANKSP